MGLFDLLFNRNKNTKKHPRNNPNQYINYQPKYYIHPNSSNPKKEYELLYEEEFFFDTLLEKSTHLKGEYSLSRLSNGTINVSYNGHPIGKIKLQGRKKLMMYMKNLYDSETIEGDLNDFIKPIDNWISYIKKYLKG